MKPANEVSEGEIESLFNAIKAFDGYPTMKELRKMAPNLSPLQINVIVRYLERSGAIVIDTDSYIVWTQKDEEQLTLGEVAEMSSDLKRYLERTPK
jgi:hypothetical protein